MVWPAGNVVSSVLGSLRHALTAVAARCRNNWTIAAFCAARPRSSRLTTCTPAAAMEPLGKTITIPTGLPACFCGCLRASCEALLHGAQGTELNRRPLARQASALPLSYLGILVN